MWKLFLGLVKRSLNPVRSIKNLTKIVKNPRKAIRRKATQPIRSAKSEIKRAKRLGRFVKLTFSPKARLIEDTFVKAKITYSLVDEENLLLAKRTSASRDTSELTKELTESSKALRGRTTEEIRAINKTITKELATLGVDSQERLEQVVRDAEFREDIVKANSYETFMDNWKDGFFAYKPEELGMSEDEREAVWEQITAERTYNKFVEEKLK